MSNNAPGDRFVHPYLTLMSYSYNLTHVISTIGKINKESFHVTSVLYSWNWTSISLVPCHIDGTMTSSSECPAVSVIMHGSECFFKPLVTNGLSHPCHLDESTSTLRGIRSIFSANRIAPDFCGVTSGAIPFAYVP